ncbi:MAG: hypothetical protein AB7D43_03155 [Sulfurimonadaceae bacterium]
MSNTVCNCEDLKALMELMAESIKENIAQEIQASNDKLVQDITAALLQATQSSNS